MYMIQTWVIENDYADDLMFSILNFKCIDIHYSASCDLWGHISTLGGENVMNQSVVFDDHSCRS